MLTAVRKNNIKLASIGNDILIQFSFPIDLISIPESTYALDNEDIYDRESRKQLVHDKSIKLLNKDERFYSFNLDSFFEAGYAIADSASQLREKESVSLKQKWYQMVRFSLRQNSTNDEASLQLLELILAKYKWKVRAYLNSNSETKFLSINCEDFVKKETPYHTLKCNAGKLVIEP